MADTQGQREQRRSEASPTRMADTHLELVSCLRSSEQQHSEPRHVHHARRRGARAMFGSVPRKRPLSPATQTSEPERRPRSSLIFNHRLRACTASLARHHTVSAQLPMAAARTMSLLVPFLASTAALQLALSPCRAPALPRRAGAPCMKYSAINDLSLLLTDTEVSSLALRRVSAARLGPRHPASPHTHTLHYNHRSRPPPASPI